MIIAQGCVAAEAQHTQCRVVGGGDPRQIDRQAQHIASGETSGDGDRCSADLTTVAIRQNQIRIEHHRWISLPIVRRRIHLQCDFRRVVDAIHQQTAGGGKARQCQVAVDSYVVIDAGDQAAVEIERGSNGDSAAVAITTAHRVLEQQGVGASTAQVSGARAAAGVQRDRQQGRAGGAVDRDRPIKVKGEDQRVAGAVGAIGRQGDLADHRCIALVSSHIHQHRARRHRHSTAVIACHHREGTQGIGATAIGIGRRRPIRIGIGIDLGIATGAIGRCCRQGGAKQQRTTQ